MVRLLATMFGQALNVPESAVRTMLDGYQDVLGQVIYTPEYATIQRQRKKQVAEKQVKKKLDDETLLRRLERLSDPAEEPGPREKAGARKR